MSGPGVRVGLTGGIGSGKSTVARAFEQHGALIVDADAIQRLVVAPGSAGLAEISAQFGPDMLTADGELDRSAMAKLVFADESARRRLEAITHPLIQAETLRQMAQAKPGQVVVHDIPLLVELGRQDDYDLVVVVDAPLDVRLERLIRDRGMTREAAMERINAQATTEQRRVVAEVWLDNDGTRDDLLDQVERAWNERVVPLIHRNTGVVGPQV